MFPPLPGWTTSRPASHIARTGHGLASARASAWARPSSPLVSTAPPAQARVPRWRLSARAAKRASAKSTGNTSPPRARGHALGPGVEGQGLKGRWLRALTHLRTRPGPVGQRQRPPGLKVPAKRLRGGEAAEPLGRPGQEEPREGPAPVQNVRQHRQPVAPLEGQPLGVLLRRRRVSVGGFKHSPGGARPVEGRTGGPLLGPKEGWGRAPRPQRPQSLQRARRHLRRVPVALENKSTQGGKSRQERFEEAEELLAHGLRVVVRIKPASRGAACHHAPGDVDFHHRVERKAVQSTLQREALRPAAPRRDAPSPREAGTPSCGGALP